MSRYILGIGVGCMDSRVVYRADAIMHVVAPLGSKSVHRRMGRSNPSRTTDLSRASKGGARQEVQTPGEVGGGKQRSTLPLALIRAIRDATRSGERA